MFLIIRKTFEKYCEIVGEMSILLWDTLYWIFHPPYNMKNIFHQLYEVGVCSFPVIVLTSFTTGMVLALQMGLVTQRWFGYPIFIGMIVAFSLVKELGPILTSVVIAGRVGASIAAEIGTMKVTEQIDALHTLGTNPVKYLAVPRFIACTIMVVVLSFLANIVGIFGGLFVSVNVLDVPASVYISDIVDYMYINDLMHGVIKTVFFGIIIAWVSLYKGFSCRGGAEGVGKATTSAVVLSMVLILVSDYFLTSLLVTFNIGAGKAFLN